MRSAFSLVELMVVMAVAVLLTALMMPAMRQVHENAQRVMCMANLQQIGHAFILYGSDHNDNLPQSAALTLNGVARPEDLMISRRPPGQAAGWDGMGRLYDGHYLNTCECFYCPSHHGDHPIERYAKMWDQSSVSAPIFTNYHYAGHLDWKNGNTRRNMLDSNLVLATDGLRTASDFNHMLGMNILRADGSVRWYDDVDNIYQMLPQDAQEATTPDYLNLWDIVADSD